MWYVTSISGWESFITTLKIQDGDGTLKADAT